MQVRRSYIIVIGIWLAISWTSSANAQIQDTCYTVQNFINMNVVPTRIRLSIFLSGNNSKDEIPEETRKSVCSDAELLRSQSEIALQKAKFLNASKQKSIVCQSLQPEVIGKLAEAVKLKETFHCDP